MSDDTDAILDDLLSRWHGWRMKYTPARGFNSRALVVGEYVISRQYDDFNGALDDAIEADIMRSLDFQISEMTVVHRAAISANARALHVGARFFSHPYLPADREERNAIVKQARAALIKRALAAGVM